MNNDLTYTEFYAKLYETLYHEKHLHQKTSLALIDYFRKKGLSHSDAILDIGCGTGDHTKIIAEKGYSIVGIDISKNMIHEAKKKNNPKLDLTFHEVKLENFKQNFQYIYSIGHVINYLETKENLLSFLQEVSRITTANGLFIFDCWRTKAILSIPPKILKDSQKTEKFTINRTVKPTLNREKNTVLLDYFYEIKNKTTVVQHELKLFTEEEIETAINNSHFTIEKIYNSVIDLKPLEEHDRYMTYILKKS